MKKILTIGLIFLLVSGCERKETEPASISYDLSVLNDTMAYSQLMNIIKDPADYLGKGIKLTGIYSASFNGFSNSYNYMVTIQDNTQCCAQGIEFVLKEKDEYPQEGDIITLSGVLDFFEEGKHGYCYIKDAMIEK